MKMKKKICAGALAFVGLAIPSLGLGAFGDIPCSNCHGWNDCTSPKGECGSCHALPPATGAHLAHFGGVNQPVTYGDLRLTADFAGGQAVTVNLIGCGNCHPLDAASHGNGVWGDIELANPAAPAGSIKAANSGASYAPATGTCGNVYCHSANSWTTEGDVPMPWPAGSLPDNIVTTRVYKDVQWNSGTTLGCNGCHGNSPKTGSPDNSGGSGDSHYWIDDYGYEDLHVWNHGFAAIGCRTCHYETVREPSTTGIGPDGLRFYNDVALFDKARHVNGAVDVVFDTENGFTYNASSGAITYDFAGAAYDPATKTCTNVGCHNGGTKAEDSVVWGTPYRWWDDQECDRCHQFYGTP